MDIEAPINCTCFNLRKAARAVTQAYDEALKPSGLRSTQMALLTVVESRGPSAITELAEELVMDRTTLTRNLRPLMDRGLLEVVAGADRRQRPVAITAEGRAKLAEALPLWREVQSRLADRLGHERWTGLLRGLEQVAHLA